MFAPPGEAWTRVSPRLATARCVVLCAAVALVAVVAAVVLVVLGAPVAAVVVVLAALALALWGCWLVRRRVRSWGYAERAEDLLVTGGLLRRRLVIVPYGGCSSST